MSLFYYIYQGDCRFGRCNEVSIACSCFFSATRTIVTLISGVKKSHSDACFHSPMGRYIRIRRAKTGAEAFIPLHPVAEQILELYNTTDNEKPVFPLPVRDILWYEVHGLGVALGMKENLSYHMARHSFGTLMMTSGIPIESIAKMMGHTNINSTQVYAQVTDQKISSDMDWLMKRRKRKDTDWVKS